MAKKVCAEPGCPVLTDTTRCPDHTRARDKARGTRQARGYDAEYDKQKRAPAFANATHCATCGKPFTPDNPKTAGHVIAIRDGGQGAPIKPECRRCNYGWRRTGS